MNADQTPPPLVVLLLVAAALVLLLFVVCNPFSTQAPHSAPVWWVSLKAPQYPEAAFPDGIRIHFHVDGVFNGCRLVGSREKHEDEALDCKHEMDAINHYVGMYPIAAGAPVERLFSPFVFTLLGLMLVAFVLPRRRVRALTLLGGGLAIAVWMSLAVYGNGGVGMLSASYRADLTDTMDLDPADIADWSGYAATQASYRDAVGRYFRDPVAIDSRAQVVAAAIHVVYGALVAAMGVLVLGVWRSRLFYWLLVGVPALLPVFFLLDYAGWLWWFGHTLNDMGAFTVKPFMPTVFGVGKVAQFSTHSYPYWGFGLMVAFGTVLGLAALLRYRQIRAIDGARGA